MTKVSIITKAGNKYSLLLDYDKKDVADFFVLAKAENHTATLNTTDGKEVIISLRDIDVIEVIKND